MSARLRLYATVVSAAALLVWFAPAVAVAARAQAAATAPGVIVFVGSSIFHRWTALSRQMAPLPIVNLAFDGAQTDDMLRLVDFRVVPYKPKVIVYYGGSNDVDAGEPAAAIADRIRQFIVRAGAALPKTRVVFVSVIRAPEKEDRWDVVDAVNRRVEALAATMKRVEYVDVNPVLVNKDHTPRIELYLSDRLHFRPPAYEELALVLKPVVAKAFEKP